MEMRQIVAMQTFAEPKKTKLVLLPHCDRSFEALGGALEGVDSGACRSG